MVNASLIDRYALDVTFFFWKKGRKYWCSLLAVLS